jgi:excisionase family DNA binding protein
MPINYTITELAKIIGVKRGAVLGRIQRGSIRAEKVGGYLWVITPEEVQRLKDVNQFRPLKQGRKKKI